MATFTKYVDPVSGVNADGNGATGAPTLTLKYLLYDMPTQFWASGADVINVLIRTTGTPFTDFLQLADFKHYAGLTINVSPEDSTKRMRFSFTASGNLVSVVTNYADAAARINVSFTDGDFTGNLSNLWTHGGKVTPVNLTFTRCHFNANATASLFNWPGTATTTVNWPIITFVDCTFSGPMQLVVPYCESFTMTGCSFTNSGNSGQNGPLISVSRAKTYTITNNTFKMRGAANYPLFKWTDSQYAENITITGNVIDARDWTGSNAWGIVEAQYLNATRLTANRCNFTFSENAILHNMTERPGLHIGTIDDEGLSRSEQIALARNASWGTVRVNQNSFHCNRSTAGGGLFLGLGPGEAAQVAEAKENYIYSGPPTAQQGHTLALYGNNWTVTGNRVIGSLTMLIFGNGNTVTGNHCTGYGTVCWFGRTGGGTWEGSTGNTVTGNTFECVGPAGQKCLSDYNYHVDVYGDGAGQVAFDNVLDNNIYTVTNGGTLADLNSIQCSTMAQIRNVWRTGTADGGGSTGWGENPTNDAHSGYRDLQELRPAPSQIGIGI